LPRHDQHLAARQALRHARSHVRMRRGHRHGLAGRGVRLRGGRGCACVQLADRLTARSRSMTPGERSL
jgi:hypothetical protein